MRVFETIFAILAIFVSCSKPQAPKEPEININPGVVSDEGLKYGTNIYGYVHCGEKALQGVVVSDGYEVTVTDERGIYQLKSSKKNGYVFVSLPSGYRAESDGVLPLFHRYLKYDEKILERADFELVDDGDQTDHIMLFFGDIHLAGRYNNDIGQFNSFVADVNSYLESNRDKKIYAMTLGDMSWDTFWISNAFGLDRYLEHANKIKGLQIFHTIGNHDHELECAGDWNTVTRYKKIIAPTYYSFNIGGIHYIALDNIECTNNGAGDKSYNQLVVPDIITWLDKDLSYVDKHTPIVVTMHAPLYYESGSFCIDEGMKFINSFSGFDTVHIVTGHTHKMWNVDNLDKSIHIYEHNSGAVCAAWWWSAYLTPGVHVAQDGAPGGYRIMEISGKSMKWQYKGTGRPISEQMRLYDRNVSDLTALIPDANAKNQSAFADYASGWVGTSTRNYVYANIWDYDEDWKLSATEDGAAVDISRVGMKDPLYLGAYVAKRLNAPTDQDVSFTPSTTKHMFVVKCRKEKSTVVVTAVDPFGRKYTQTIVRPHPFSLEDYQ